MANVALNKYADASHSMFPYQPAKAVDGVLTPLNRWVGSAPLSSSGTPTPVWLRVDLGAFYWINRWVVKQMGAVGWPVPPSTALYNLCDYKLQGSLDNANWFDIDTVTNNGAHSTDRTFAPTKVRWARIYVTKGLRCNPNFASIVDLEIYEVDPTSAKLTGLALSAGTLTPPFSGTTFNYTASVGDNESITVTPTAEDSRATIKVNGIPTTSGQPSAPVSLNMGSNPVIVEVTPFIGKPQNYTVAVTKTSSAYLTGLAIVGMRGGGLNEPFSKTTYNYTATVINSKTTVQIISTAEDGNATITVNGVPVGSGTESQEINLNVGANTVTIVVTSSAGAVQKTYTIVITRQAA